MIEEDKRFLGFISQFDNGELNSVATASGYSIERKLVDNVYYEFECYRMLDESYRDTNEIIWERRTLIAVKSTFQQAMYFCQRHYEKHQLGYIDRIICHLVRLWWKFKSWREEVSNG